MQTEKKVSDGRQPVILFADDDVTCLDNWVIKFWMRKMG
jgi:hypothetical protein